MLGHVSNQIGFGWSPNMKTINVNWEGWLAGCYFKNKTMSKTWHLILQRYWLWSLINTPGFIRYSATTPWNKHWRKFAMKLNWNDLESISQVLYLKKFKLLMSWLPKTFYQKTSYSHFVQFLTEEIFVVGRFLFHQRSEISKREIQLAFELLCY